MLIFFLILMFSMSLINFIFNQKHLLVMLISLEFLMVILYFNIFIYLSMLKFEFFFSMIFLVMSVCEGVLALSSLVLMVRMHSNDYILTFSFLW